MEWDLFVSDPIVWFFHFIIPHLPVPYIFGTRDLVNSYLIYWQLGAWFRIYRELEDQGNLYLE